MSKLTEIAFFSEDVARMTGFYEKLLGEAPVAKSEDMAIFMQGNTKIFIHRNYVPKEGELPPENHFAFSVDDVDVACQELVGHGYQIEIPAKDYYWGYSAYLRDPDGHLLELIQTETES